MAFEGPIYGSTADGGSDAGVHATFIRDRPVWWAFEYSLEKCRPTTVTATRSRVARLHRAMRSLQLRHGLWAIGWQDDDQDALLRHLCERIVSEGGEAAVHRVGVASETDIALQSKLNRTCERLWDSFFDGADKYELRAWAGRPPGAQAAALEALRSEFCSVLAHDFVAGDGLRRAEATLDRLTEDILGADGMGLAAPTTNAGRELKWCSWGLQSGQTAAVACIIPTPSLAWELAFGDFERSTYVPSATSMPLRNGAFRWTGARSSTAAVAEALTLRLAHFDALIAG